MSSWPPYFEPIRRKSAQRWMQLESDPDLAGPWHQLFKQVQSPRHILSELLQNADDAGATEANVSIVDDEFLFEHNGEDFTESHFASLCRFGYSNKRALHTIGFRGIGFKSTFSLGDEVQLLTPSLAVSFHRKRFTEPRWLSDDQRSQGNTRIRVRISDAHRLREVERNIEDWHESPVSLLFFKNIRRMTLGDREVHWGSMGPGPIASSEWMALLGQEDTEFLLVRSQAEDFPEDALAEIRQERMLGMDEETDFPPCRVELVVGAKGRLFVVLPTGVATELPFACNAPFIQDPARLKIKDPETSPTNRWLLERAGSLAASAMLGWLGRSELPAAERVGAYDLLPDVDRNGSDLSDACGTIVEESFEEYIADHPILLTDEGDVKLPLECVVLPAVPLSVWSGDDSLARLDKKQRAPLCQHVSTSNRQKLQRWGLLEVIKKSDILAALQQVSMPRPATWVQLLDLWAYVAPEVTGYAQPGVAKRIRIVPAESGHDLCAGAEMVRLARQKLLISKDDWALVSAHLVVLSQGWLSFLDEERRRAVELEDAGLLAKLDAAAALLASFGLSGPSDVKRVMDGVARSCFSTKGIKVSTCITLAQIAAKLGAAVGDAFRFVTRDNHLRAASDDVMFDNDGTLVELIPPQYESSRLLHEGYEAAFTSCSETEWRIWLKAGRSGLQACPKISQRTEPVFGEARISQEARRRGVKGDLHFPYVTAQFVIHDWDFDEGYWQFWSAEAKSDPHLWSKVATRVISFAHEQAFSARSAYIGQVATTGSVRSIIGEPAVASWVLRLRDLPCLPDTRGVPRLPAELLRRTPETESMLDVEAFIDGRLDTEANRVLLDLLGVRSAPTGPDRLLDILRGLAESSSPPVREVDKWYRRLDQMINGCSTSDFQTLQRALRNENLILTSESQWVTATSVFLFPDEEGVPGAALVRPSVVDLQLWRRIGVAERPTPDLAMAWLKRLPSGASLAPEDARRVRALMGRYPVRIWEECAHWTNLAGEWVPTSSLEYAVSMQTLVPYRHLYPNIRQKTADLTRLREEAASQAPFVALPALSGVLEERLQRDTATPVRSEPKAWLVTLGAELTRATFEAEQDTQRVRISAERLARTRWCAAPVLEVVPYISGTPAGVARSADVLWIDDTLYVSDMSRAKQAKRIPEEVAKAFERSDIRSALDFSFERKSEDVIAYLEENFTLEPRAIIPGPDSDASAEDVEESRDEATAAISADVREESSSLTAAAPELVAETDVDWSDSDVDGERPAATPRSIPELPEVAATRPRPSPSPALPGIVERYATALGLRKKAVDLFEGGTGERIEREHGGLFPWVHRDASGDVVRYYWPKEHSLERAPLELPADIWSMLTAKPERYALILSQIDGRPVAISGARLAAMQQEGELDLFPATYRLAMTHERVS